MTSNQLKYWELKESQRHNVEDESIGKANAASQRIHVMNEGTHWRVSDLTNMITAVGKLAGPLSGSAVGAIIGG